MERVDYESMVIQDILNAHDRGELNISPWYQRRAVWSSSHKAYLINSIFETMPVPSIYIRHAIDLDLEKTVKEVVDGQQRLRSVIEYKANEFSARHPDHKRRVLFRDLLPAQRQAFLMAKLPVAYLIGADDTDVIEIFGRLNAVSKTLNAQEKRSALYSGEFHQYCLREAATRLSIWRGLGVFTATNISRMDEVQFTAELSMALEGGMSDFSAARINKAYKDWDNDFPHREDVAVRLNRIFKLIGSLNPSAVKDTIFSRSPLFYSLVLVLDSEKRLPSKANLELALSDIDARFNDPRPVSERPAEDLAFVAACTASTQRIKSHQTRFDYIKSSI
ncbi:DUF262 domain-containing protein [Ilumatobacter sp.]|uniref:DUF262 domain-containing protein n=1 Tax=Ilumatobacter sp. TaxID=1967498 RepID=UPI0037510498